MPVKRRPSVRKPPTRTRQGAPSRLLSSDEKRQLILAHAEARRPIDATQRASVWMGVIVCSTLIIGAWIYTVGGSIKKSFASPIDASVRQAIDENMPLTGDGSNQWEDIRQRLSAMTEQRVAVDSLIEQFASSSLSETSSTRNAVFQPNDSSQTSTLHSLPLSN